VLITTAHGPAATLHVATAPIRSRLNDSDDATAQLGQMAPAQPRKVDDVDGLSRHTQIGKLSAQRCRCVGTLLDILGLASELQRCQERAKPGVVLTGIEANPPDQVSQARDGRQPRGPDLVGHRRLACHLTCPSEVTGNRGSRQTSTVLVVPFLKHPDALAQHLDMRGFNPGWEASMSR
jgi:hypothetical protein